MFLAKALWFTPYVLLLGLFYVGRRFKHTDRFASYFSEQQQLGVDFSRKEKSSRIKETSIVTIATGGYDASFLTTTTRIQGRFQGLVFVISDDPNYFKRAEIEATVVHVDIPRDSLDAVSLKTQLFDIIHSSSVEIEDSEVVTVGDSLLYLDADIQVNSRIDEFLGKIEPWDPSCSIYAVPERWYAASTWNTGTMLLDRVYSSELLMEWHRLITDNHDFIRKGQKIYSKDQWALMKLLEDKHDTRFKVCPLPNAVSFAADFMTRYVWGAYDSTFTHFTSSKKESGRSFKHMGLKSSRVQEQV